MDHDENTCSTGLLIDFNSPLSKRTLRPPLIPAPKPKDQISVSPTTNNPFDVVARRALSPDPFDKAFESAFNTLNEIKQNSESHTDNHCQLKDDSEQNVKKYEGNVTQLDNKKPFEKFHSPTEDNSVVNTCDTNNVNTWVATQDDQINNGCTNSNTSSDFSHSWEVDNYLSVENGVQVKNETVINNCTESKTTNTSDVVKPSSLFPKDCNETSQVSGDFSTDEDLKAMIAKRVNKCIQKVMDNSFKLTSSKSSDNLQKAGEDTRIKNTFNRRSLSFVTVSNNQNKCDKLNKSCTDHSLNNKSFNLENQNMETPDSSMDSFNLPPMSPASNDVSKNDNVFLNSENEEVFQEANKLARTFSKLAESFTKVEVDDDLLSCKPEWLYADSSEDEEDKLRKDPSLNVRVSLTNSMTQGEPDSQALSIFKTRNRRSLGHLLTTSNVQDESNLKRSFSIGSRPKQIVVPVIPTVASLVPAPVVGVEDEPLKLKKRIGGDAKRGPMRAVMPVQSMTKESVSQQGKNIKKRDVSPIRKPMSVQIIETPCKNTSQLGIHPVASSTPNKSVNGKGMSRLQTPSIDIPSNKRRSLGSTLESRKSRTPTVEDGSRQRSSSANSGIPTPVTVLTNRLLVKPQLSAVNSPSKPKSTSCLPRSNLSNSQIAKHDNKCDKQTAKQVKSSFNPRALNEVKSRVNRVKATVNAVSNFVVGKGKKSAAKDKENRVPV